MQFNRKRKKQKHMLKLRKEREKMRQEAADSYDGKLFFKEYGLPDIYAMRSRFIGRVVKGSNPKNINVDEKLRSLIASRRSKS